MKKRILSLFLALGLSVSLLTTGALAADDGLSNFKSVNTYTTGTFTDVPADTWYTSNVKTAYEMDLMKGTSGTAFSPDGNITVGSTIALACRLHSIYNTGAANFVQGDPWYQVYVDYAVKNGIISQGQFTDYNAVATRRQFAAILARALPAEALEAKNTVDDGMIPDVAAGSDNYNDIYLLYRAGILTGSDSKGTFQPETTITRSSVAAIVSRMANPALRQNISLTYVNLTGLTLTGLSLEAGKTGAISVQMAPSNATVKSLTWSSSDASVASVSNGTVTAHKAGTATITAVAYNGVSGSCTVTVTAAPVAVSSVTLNQTTMTLDVGKTGTLTATVQPADAVNKNITWTSSNTAVATVWSGTVTAVAPGTVTITASTPNGKSASCTVTVKKPASSGYQSYSRFAGVPDFGLVMGTYATNSTYDPSDNSGGFFYSYTSIKNAGHGEDFAERYAAALVASGFRYMDSFVNDDGGTTLIYTNGTYFVMMGASVAGGIPGILIVVTP